MMLLDDDLIKNSTYTKINLKAKKKKKGILPTYYPISEELKIMNIMTYFKVTFKSFLKKCLGLNVTINLVSK